MYMVEVKVDYRKIDWCLKSLPSLPLFQCQFKMKRKVAYAELLD